MKALFIVGTLVTMIASLVTLFSGDTKEALLWLLVSGQAIQFLQIAES